MAAISSQFDGTNESVILENKGAALIDIGNGVLRLQLRTAQNTFDDEVRQMFVAAVEELERGAWAGMVIANDGDDFCTRAELPGGLLSRKPSDLDRELKAIGDALMAVRFCSKPVVVAPFGRTLGIGAEIAMSGARIVAAADAQIGLVEAEAGLIPAAGGCKELVRRVLSPVMKLAPNADPYPFVQNVVQTIAMAKVSVNADDARGLGFLTPADRIVADRGQLLFEARREVLELAEAGYAPPAGSKNCFAAGRDVHAAVAATAYMAREGGYISDYDAFLTGKIASVICGSELSAGQWVDEEFFLDRERETFIALCSEPKTVERIEHLLAAGKPLRN